jgi:hypothetical protein
MDVIRRTLTKNRDGRFTQKFDFTTFSIAFSKPPEVMTNFQKLLKWIKYAFVIGLPGDIDTYESCSSATTPQPRTVEKMIGDENEILELMKGVNYRGTSQYQHELVARHFITNDSKCIATEMPLWLMSKDSPNTKPWGGSVDIVRVPHTNRIQLWDFKPDADKVDQKKVGPQMARYGIMLSKVANIKLEEIDLFYFDEKSTYKITL